MTRKRQMLRNLEAKWSFLSVQQAFHLAPVRTTLRLASWRIRCLLGKAAIIDLRRWGVRMFLPPYCRGAAKLTDAFRADYERERTFLGGLLSPGHVWFY